MYPVARFSVIASFS